MRALKTVVVCGVFLAPLASAQDSAGAQPSEELDVIVVTAEKIDRSLQDTATSVSVTTAAEIEALNIVDIEDVLRRVGNAGFITVGSGRNEQFTLRGVSSQGVTPGTSTPVSTLYLDGAVVPNQGAGTAISNLFDVKQIEVLRGAQSTVQGRNSLIGALSITTIDPDLEEWGGRARATYGNYGSWEVSAATGGPLVDDVLGVRFQVQQIESDGFVTRPDGSDGDEESSTLFRTKLRWEPESMPGFTVNLSGTFSREDDGAVLVSADDPGARNQVTDIPQQTERDLNLLSARIDVPLSQDWSLVSLTTYSTLEERATTDFDGLPDQGFPTTAIRFDNIDESDALQEFRFIYSGEGRVRGFAGVLYARREAETDIDARQTFGVPVVDLTALGLNQVYQGVVGIDAPPGVPRFLNDPLLLGSFLPIRSEIGLDPDFETLALFGELEYRIGDRWNINAGFRYEREEATFSGFQLNSLLDPDDQAAVGAGNPLLPGAIAAGLVDAGFPQAQADAASGPIASFYPQFANGAIAAAFGNPDVLLPVDLSGDDEFTVFLPKLAITYDVTDSLSLSFAAQKAYRPGGLGINPVQTFVYSVDEEESLNYELALRSAWLDNRVFLNANVFYIDWTDQQLEVQLTPTPQDTVVLNVGESELFGAEVELRALLNDSVEVFASIGVLDTEVTDDQRDNPIGGSLEGDEFSFAPDLTGALGLLYRAPNGFSASADVNYQSESEPLLPNFDDGRKNESRAIVNARFAYEQPSYSVFVFASNLFDEVYLANAEAAGGGVVVGDPRTYGVGFTLDW